MVPLVFSLLYLEKEKQNSQTMFVKKNIPYDYVDGTFALSFPYYYNSLQKFV